MFKLHFKKTIPALTFLLWISFPSMAQQAAGTVNIIGQMKNVMWKGELLGNIHIDTITVKTNLYGLGPVEYLKGEILIMDGVSYQSTVVNDTMMNVEETFDIKAPFFSYAHIARWSRQPLPGDILTMQQLEIYLDSITRSAPRPFLFKLTGIGEQAAIHIVNLPAGTRVRSPAEAHTGQKTYELKNEASEILGFFSTVHQAVFTHHDSFLHMHLITADRQQMGHLDQALFKKGTMTLYLPAD